MKEGNLIMLEAGDIDVLADLIADKLAVKMANTSVNARAKEDDLIGTTEAARILGCSTRTMAAYRAKKLFRVVMRGPRKALYFRNDIEAFRDANTRPGRDMKRK